MKKFKKLFFMAVFTICSFAILGTVNAAGQATNPAMVCIPNSLEVGDSTTCYFIANIQGKVKGFVTKVYLLDGLKIAEESLENGINVGGGENSDLVVIKNGQSAQIGNETVTCNTTDNRDSRIGNSKVEQEFCAIFHNGDFTNAVSESLKNAVTEDDDTNNNTDYSQNNYGVIAEFKVTLSENRNTCGRICVFAKYVPVYEGGEAEDHTYSNPFATTGGTPCGEIDPEIPENIDTGAFASYAILIAGALIAISSIAIAKKQKKIFKV